MLRLRRDPFPTALVTDLLAIARMLFRAWRASREPAHKLRELESIGKRLRRSLALGTAAAGTVEHANAWELAEDAAERLGKVIGGQERTLRLVTTALAGLERRPAPPTPRALEEREARRQARLRRS